MTDVHSQIEHLARQRELLERALHSVPEVNFENRIPGKWSAREHLAHLARHQGIFLDRIRRILQEEKPILPSYVAEEDAHWQEWHQLRVREIEARWLEQRSAFIALLQNLSSEQFLRIGTHSTMGELTLHEWIDFFLVHEGHHLLSVLKIIRGRTV
ncbi:MAG TPA: DinB family protein [Pseudacidobacterium sp.]|jgi:uncharacterized damage-inducible protein DinB|nr:DinB family protein [Pseudacidobacterium sp.]